MMCHPLVAIVVGFGLMAWGARAETSPIAEVLGQLPARNELGVSQPVILGAETFPRIAMLWSSAQNLQGTRTKRMAKYLSLIHI